MPGSGLDLQKSFGASVGFVARCVAEENARIISGRDVVQRFRVLELVAGSTHGLSRADVIYTCRPGERRIRSGEPVVWIGRIDPDERWRGTKALADTDDNRFDAGRAADHFEYEHRPAQLFIRMGRPQAVYALGEPMSFTVTLERDARDSVVVWTDLASGSFDVIAADGDRVPARGTIEGRTERIPPLVVGPRTSPEETVHLADRFDWLEARPWRAFTLVWRGTVRIGHSAAAPAELLSYPVRFVVRDAQTLVWGAASNGLACGLATGVDTVRQGDHVPLHPGLRFESGSADRTTGILDKTPEQFRFTFTNRETGEVFHRDPFHSQGLPYIPGPEDFVFVRDHPLGLRLVPVPLLTPEGEQLPAGVYSVVAEYQNNGAGKPVIGSEPCHTEPYNGPLTSWKGKIESEPVVLAVHRADPMQQEIRLKSSFTLKQSEHRVCWGMTAEDPLVVTVVRRPGYYIAKEDSTLLAVADGNFRLVRLGLGSSTWGSDGWSCGLQEDETRRILAGALVAIRAQVTLFETSNPPGHMWNPHEGDYHVLWRGRIETLGLTLAHPGR